MPHIVFFYFVGQSVAHVFANWWLSLLTVSLVGVIDLIITVTSSSTEFYWADAVGGWIGWLSAVWVSEFIIKVPSIDFAHNANKFKVSINAIIQLLIFIGIFSILLLVVDPTMLLMIGVFIVHMLGFIPIVHIGYLVQRCSDTKQHMFYVYWVAITLVTDIVFIIMYAITSSLEDTLYTALGTSISIIIVSILYFKFRAKTKK